MRARIYATSAERQKAYRARQAGPSIIATSMTAKKAKRPPSRPARLVATTESLRLLQGEYESWLESVPESLAEGRVAERLRETIEQLEAAIDILDEIQPPRPFERE